MFANPRGTDGSAPYLPTLSRQRGWAHRRLAAGAVALPWLTVLLVLVASPRACVSAAEGPAALAELDAALRQHPRLAALRFDVEASRESAGAASALPDPEVSVSLNNFPLLDPSFDEYLPTNRAIGVSQAIPNTRVRRAKSQAQTQRTRLGELAVARTLAELRGRLLSALIDRERVVRQRALASARDTRYAELVEVIQAEIDAGRPLVFRLSQIDVERAEAAQELAELTGEAARIDAQLIDLVGYPAAVVAPPLVLSERAGDAGDFHDVRIAEARIAVSDAGVAQAQGAYGPDWRVSLQWQQRESGRGGAGSEFDGDDWLSATLGITVPLWRQKRQAPNLRAARARRSSAHSTALAAARSSEARWTGLLATVDAATRSTQILQGKLEALEAQIAAARTNYEAGRGDYSQVIDGEIATLRLQSQLAAEQARRERMIAQANAMLAVYP